MYLIGDSFDLYADRADAGANYWDTSNTGWGLSTKARFCMGRSLTGNIDGVYLIKDGGPNQSTWFVCVSFLQTTALGAAAVNKYISLRDGGTAQCSIGFRLDGSIVLTSGGPGGSILATWSGAFVANSFDNFRFKVVINNSTGSFEGRKNQASSNSFTATGLNTRGGTANNYANGVALGHNTGSESSNFDDLLIYNNLAGDTLNDWIADVRAIPMMPNADTAQKQFATNNTAGLQSGMTNNSSTRALSANTLLTNGPWVAQAGGTFTTATVEFNAGFTGNAKLALYMMDGLNANFATETMPGTLLGVSNVLTNPGSGAQTFTFASAQPLMRGFSYGWALLTDAACVLKSSGVGVGGGSSISQTYGSGFPSSVSGFAWTGTSLSDFTAYATVTLTNFGCVSDNQQDGAVSYLFDATVGHFDLFNLNPLSYTPASIFGVNVRSFVSKSDASGKGFKVAGKSGATSFETAEYNPLTTASCFNTFYAYDPNTSAAFAAAALAALQLGPKVSS